MGLADRHHTELPSELTLWRLAGGRPPTGDAPGGDEDPAEALGRELEIRLSTAERRRGAHYTPAAVADEVVSRALARHLDGPEAPTVVDPACGGGALLLASARRLAAAGFDRATVARDLLWGSDVDPLAAAVTEAALALWSGGQAPGAGHLTVADALAPEPTWQARFDVVVGNPPFQGQLRRATTRSAVEVARLRARWGEAVSPYVDTAALFLLAAVDLARPGGTTALIQPQSTVAARDAAGVRDALRTTARLREMWAPDGHLFGASVHVCVPVLEVLASGAEATDRQSAWTDALADARGVPVVGGWGTNPGPTVADVAEVVAGFRDEYYGLVPHVREATGADEEGAPLVTSGAIGLGHLATGGRPIRFAKQRWSAPVVDLATIAQRPDRLRAWIERLQRPKVVVASQTRVVEAAPDHSGALVPVTPVISVVPNAPTDVGRMTALLCSPPVSAWAAREAAGTALSADAIRVSAALVSALPLPADESEWERAAAALAEGDLLTFAEAATAMYRLGRHTANAVVEWWHARR